jgi:hypothetical protein
LGKALDNIEAIALTVFEAVKKLLTTAQVALSLDDQFIDPRKTAATLDCFGYHLYLQERQTYAKFLELLNTGIFPIFPYSAYHRQMNNLQN